MSEPRGSERLGRWIGPSVVARNGKGMRHGELPLPCSHARLARLWQRRRRRRRACECVGVCVCGCAEACAGVDGVRLGAAAAVVAEEVGRLRLVARHLRTRANDGDAVLWELERCVCRTHARSVARLVYLAGIAVCSLVSSGGLDGVADPYVAFAEEQAFRGFAERTPAMWFGYCKDLIDEGRKDLKANRMFRIVTR